MLLNVTKIMTVAAIVATGLSLLLNNFHILGGAPLWYVSVIFFFLTALLLNLILFKQNTDPKEFVFKIMITSMLRLLLCMIGIFIYSLIDKAGLKGFALHFMLHYILFTVFEIAYLLRFAKTNNQKTSV
jgi:hypothetical protein